MAKSARKLEAAPSSWARHTGLVSQRKPQGPNACQGRCWQRHENNQPGPQHSNDNFGREQVMIIASTVVISPVHGSEFWVQSASQKLDQPAGQIPSTSLANLGKAQTFDALQTRRPSHLLREEIGHPKQRHKKNGPITSAQQQRHQTHGRSEAQLAWRKTIGRTPQDPEKGGMEPCFTKGNKMSPINREQFQLPLRSISPRSQISHNNSLNEFLISLYYNIL